MSIRLVDQVIHLEGRCTAGDAEELLAMLQEHSGALVDITGLARMHMAVMQVLLALRPPIKGPAATGPLSQEIFLGLISDRDRGQKNF